MFLQLSLFSLLAIVAASTVPAIRMQDDTDLPSTGLFTVGGQDVKIEDAPYQVFLYSSDGIHCGGSIISEKWVLTAAQCIPKPPHFITVRAGSLTKWAGGSVHVVAQTIVHENYTMNSGRMPVNDLALLELNPPLELDMTRKPVSLFKKNEIAYPGINATILGWGTSKDDKGKKLEVLQAVYLPVISKQSCKESYEAIIQLPEDKICAGLPEGSMSTCKGDEGGPMTIENRLAGVVSWSYGCDKRGYPTVHTEVAAYSDWITCNTPSCPSTPSAE